MARSDWDDGITIEDDTPRTRPFVVAGGKTETSANLALETLVEALPGAHEGVRFEARQVLEQAQEATSIAELSAHLGIPVGTMMVLAGELIEDSALMAHQTVSLADLSELDIMKRIIARVSAL